MLKNKVFVGTCSYAPCKNGEQQYNLFSSKGEEFANLFTSKGRRYKVIISDVTDDK